MNKAYLVCCQNRKKVGEIWNKLKRSLSNRQPIRRLSIELIRCRISACDIGLPIFSKMRESPARSMNPFSCCWRNSSLYFSNSSSDGKSSNTLNTVTRSFFNFFNSQIKLWYRGILKKIPLWRFFIKHRRFLFRESGACLRLPLRLILLWLTSGLEFVSAISLSVKVCKLRCRTFLSAMKLCWSTIFCEEKALILVLNMRSSLLTVSLWRVSARRCRRKVWNQPSYARTNK